LGGHRKIDKKDSKKIVENMNETELLEKKGKLMVELTQIRKRSEELIEQIENIDNKLYRMRHS